MESRAVLTCIPPHLHDHVFTPRQDEYFVMSKTESLGHHPVTMGAPAPAAPPTYSLASAHASPFEKRPSWSSEPMTAWPSEKAGGPLLPTSRNAQPQPEPKWRKLPRTAVVIALVIYCGSLVNQYLGILLSARHDLSSRLSTPRSPVAPLDLAFVDHCKSLLDPPKHTYPDRLEKLVSSLSGNDGVWVAEPGPSVEYFIGAFGPGDWQPSERPFLVAVGNADEIVIVTPAFEQSRAKQHPLPPSIKDKVLWLAWAESESPYTILRDHFANRPVVLDDQVRTFIGDGVRAHHEIFHIPQIARLRQTKDAREIGLMHCANQFTLQAIRKTRARMHLGIRESETRKILYEEMAGQGLSDNGALILFGEDAALPHGSGTDRALAESDLVLIDAGGRWGGYVADITRTFPLPESRISDAHREVWEIVRAAQRAPSDLVRHSEDEDHIHFSWLDDVARETVKKGMAAYGVRPAPGPKPDYTVFTHRLGHGIGLEGHEYPYVVQGPLGEQRVKAGNAVTFEPGVYIPSGSDIGDESVNGLGVRLEDVVVFEEGEKGKLVVRWLTGPVSKWGEV